jgi:hypothetical protein
MDDKSMIGRYCQQKCKMVQEKLHLLKDGSCAIHGAFEIPGVNCGVTDCLFEAGCSLEERRDLGSIYLRSVSVHNRVLSKEQRDAETTTLRELLIEDAIASAPCCLRPALEAACPFSTTSALCKSMAQLKRDAMHRIRPLWAKLLGLVADAPSSHVPPGAADVALDDCISLLAAHDIATCKAWKPPANAQKPAGDTDGDGERDKPEMMALPVVPNVETQYQSSLFCLAAYAGSLRVIHLLLEANASMDCKPGSAGSTPLHAATAGGQADVVAALVAAGVSVTTTDAMKRSALHLACEKGAVSIVRALVAAGGNAQELCATGETPITLARKHGHPLLAAELEEARGEPMEMVPNAKLDAKEAEVNLLDLRENDGCGLDEGGCDFMYTDRKPKPRELEEDEDDE